MFKKTGLIAIMLVSLVPMVFAQAPWDFLRPFTSMATQFDFLIKIIVFLAALVIYGISLLAYLKNKSTRLLLLTLAFFLFAVKWLFKIVDLFFSPGWFISDSSENVFELVSLILLCLAIFKRKVE